MSNPRTRFTLPECLAGKCEQSGYLRWLGAKARAHAKRDQARYGASSCTVASYKTAIHNAVCNGGDRDYYTGLPLNWSLISMWNNEEAKRDRVKYKHSFGNLPTVDHTVDENGTLRFVICSWRVNDAKSDLSVPEFLELCSQVLEHQRLKWPEATAAASE